MEQITHRINALREAAGLSEARLADSSAIPRTTLKRRLIEPGAPFCFGEAPTLAPGPSAPIMQPGHRSPRRALTVARTGRPAG